MKKIARLMIDSIYEVFFKTLTLVVFILAKEKDGNFDEPIKIQTRYF